LRASGLGRAVPVLELGVLDDSKRACGVFDGLLAVEFPADAAGLAEVRMAASSGPATSCCPAEVVWDGGDWEGVLVGKDCWPACPLLMASDGSVSLAMSTAVSATSCSVGQCEAAASLQMCCLHKHQKPFFHLHCMKITVRLCTSGASSLHTGT
jgi:hypothetical protein